METGIGSIKKSVILKKKKIQVLCTGMEICWLVNEIIIIITIDLVLQNFLVGAGKMIQWLRVQTALAQDMSSTPSTHTGCSYLPVTPAPRAPMPAASKGRCADMHLPTYTHIIKTNPCAADDEVLLYRGVEEEVVCEVWTVWFFSKKRHSSVVWDSAKLNSN